MLTAVLASAPAPPARRSRHRQPVPEKVAGYPRWLTSGASMLVRRPVLLVLALLLAVAVPAGHGQQAGSRVLLVDAVVLLLLVLTVYRLLRAGTAARVRLSAAAALVALPLAAACVTVTAVDPAASLVGMIREAEIFVLIPLAVALSIEACRDLRLLLLGLIGLALLEIAVSVGQWWGGGIAADAATGRVGWTGTFGPADLTGLPATVSMGLIAATALVLVCRGRARTIAATAAGACAVWLALDGREAALVAAAVALAVMLLLARLPAAISPLAGGLLCALVLAAVAYVAIGQVSAPGVSARSGNVAGQDAEVVDGMAGPIFVDHSVTGVGLRNFPVVRDAYAPVGLSGAVGADRIEFPGNFYLAVVSEQGLVGTCALVGLLAAAAAGCSRRLVRRPPAASGTARTWRLGGLVATGLLALLAFGGVGGDLGAPSTVGAAVSFGVILWWAMAPDGAAQPW